MLFIVVILGMKLRVHNHVVVVNVTGVILSFCGGLIWIITLLKNEKQNHTQWGSMSQPYHRVVVCAAMRRGDRIIVGARHYDSVMRDQIKHSEGVEFWKQAEQGFIDQRGKFMTREEALVVALSQGQRKYRCGGDESRLFSENLY